MTAVEKPELAVNRGEQTVAGALNGFISHAATGFVGGACLDIATAFFNVGGYSLLADSLDRATGVRLLLGAEPMPPESRRRALRSESANPQRAARARLRQALEGHEQNLLVERDHLGFTFEVDAAARRLVEWLRSDTVQVRRLEGRFLHGKAFLVGDRSHGVVAGSSNFTYAGLSTNLELNLGNYSPHVVGQVRDWFDELWDEAEEYDLAALFEARFEPHLPQLVYLRMLWEFYGEELEAEVAAQGVPQIHLTSFQSDGLWRARRILEARDGVLIADEVGLGKTFLAGELIREAALDRRQRVLVITPATLRDGPWRAFISEHLLAVELVSYEELMADRRLNPEHTDAIKLAAEINDYAMVVIDEAHKLRNPGTQRAQALRRLLAGSPPKKLVMLTATPVNNSLWDLYHLLGYFLRNDAAFADAGIRSLRDHFANAMALNPDDLTPEHLFDVLDAVAVRRTRAFVKRFYPNDTIKVGG
ncbi:MAG: SNF2-related protein, partial [bacterium]|nr:SNF2-related protein [bacterium]